MNTEKSWIGCTANWNNVNDEEAKWWIIRDTDQKELARFPYSMGEHGVMAVVHAVRDLEKAAWEAGKQFGGQAMMAAGRQKMQEQYSRIVELVEHNEYLAANLETLIGDKG